MSICVSAPETQPSRCVRSGGAFNQPCCSGVKLFSLIQLGEYLSQCPWKWRCINYTKLIFKNLIFLGRSTGHLFCFSNQQLSTLHTFISGSWPIQLQYSCPKAAWLQWLREELFFHLQKKTLTDPLLEPPGPQIFCTRTVFLIVQTWKPQYSSTYENSCIIWRDFVRLPTSILMMTSKLFHFGLEDWKFVYA